MAFVKLSKVKNVLMLPLVRSQYKRWVFDTNTDDKETYPDLDQLQKLITCKLIQILPVFKNK